MQNRFLSRILRNNDRVIVFRISCGVLFVIAAFLLLFFNIFITSVRFRTDTVKFIPTSKKII